MTIDALKAVLMGVVEGITEWLPVSSTGHMILLEQLVRFNCSAAFLEMFRVVIQLGAILAVVLLYGKRLWPVFRSQAGWRMKTEVVCLWLKIATACFPAAVLGIWADDWLNDRFYNCWIVAAMLIFYGILFLGTDGNHSPTLQCMEQMTFRQALIIGVWQVLALIPGTSRSGATILGGLLLGMNRQLAAEFTFYLAIPVMVGASGLKLIKFWKEGAGLSAQEGGILFVGLTVAFLVSLLSIRFLMQYVKTHSFRAFGWYRIILGSMILLAGLAGVL